ncbi:hypothetical protein D3C72_2131230 [compost metagenome]
MRSNSSISASICGSLRVPASRSAKAVGGMPRPRSIQRTANSERSTYRYFLKRTCVPWRKSRWFFFAIDR